MRAADSDLKPRISSIRNGKSDSGKSSLTRMSGGVMCQCPLTACGTRASALADLNIHYTELSHVAYGLTQFVNIFKIESGQTKLHALRVFSKPNWTLPSPARKHARSSRREQLPLLRSGMARSFSKHMNDVGRTLMNRYMSRT